MSAPPVRVQPLGDSAATIIFGTSRSSEILQKVQGVAKALRDASLPGTLDIVPAYLSVAVYYDAGVISYREIAETLLSICGSSRGSTGAREPGRTHEIPVAYDGMDLEWVGKAAGLSTEDVIARHVARTYTVDLIGFVPGFAYLSELDPALQLNRREQPRSRVPAGSVAIAGTQTGIYPLDTPGGWHILGHTQVPIFDPARDPPARFKAGDSVRFTRVE